MINYLLLYSFLCLIFPSKESKDIDIIIDFNFKDSEIVEIEDN